MTQMNLLEAYNMHTKSGLQYKEYTTHEEWLELRDTAIGGSDMSVCMGLSPYKSKLALYREKVDGIKKDQSDNVNIRKGHDLEDVIREVYVKPYMAEKGYIVKTVPITLYNTRYPYIHANLDGIAVPDALVCDHTDNIVIEIKWVSQWGESKWDSDDYYGIPVGYYAQVQTYMFITGARKAIVCALFDSTWEMHYYEIPYNQNFVSQALTDASNFYEFHMTLKIPPKLDAELDKEEITTRAKIASGTEITLSEDMTAEIVQYKQLGNEIKDLEKRQKLLQDTLTSRYLAGQRPDSNLVKMNISVRCTNRLDTKALQEEMPDIYAKYVKASEYSVTTIK